MPPPNSRLDAPHRNVTLVKQTTAATTTPLETIQLGPARLEVLEDGRNTDHRLSAVRIYLPPHTPGPNQHWHQMHDETFLVESGTVTFTSRDQKFTATKGDYLIVPTCAPHTFANEGDEEVIMYNTFTPAFYIDYFRLMSAMVKKETENGDGKGLTREIAKEAMSRYATLQTGTTTEW